MSTKKEIISYLYDELPCFPMDLIMIMVSYLVFAPLRAVSCLNLIPRLITRPSNGPLTVWVRNIDNGAENKSTNDVVFRILPPSVPLFDNMTPWYERKIITVCYISNRYDFIIWRNNEQFQTVLADGEDYMRVSMSGILDSDIILMRLHGFRVMRYNAQDNKFAEIYTSNIGVISCAAMNKTSWVSSSFDGIRIWNQFDPKIVVPLIDEVYVLTSSFSTVIAYNHILNSMYILNSKSDQQVKEYDTPQNNYTSHDVIAFHDKCMLTSTRRTRVFNPQTKKWDFLPFGVDFGKSAYVRLINEDVFALIEIDRTILVDLNYDLIDIIHEGSSCEIFPIGSDGEAYKKDHGSNTTTIYQSVSV